MSPSRNRTRPPASESEQGVYVVPDITIKQLLSAIPAHCFKRSGPRSAVHLVWNLFVILACHKAASLADAALARHPLHPLAQSLARFAIWAVYAFWSSLFGTGLWVMAHEASHQAFAESKMANNVVGWALHSSMGVPHFAWKVTHAKHHAATGHMTQDQVFVPRTRAEMGLPPLDPAREDPRGSPAHVTAEMRAELWEAVGHSPAGEVLGLLSYLTLGWPLYLLVNISGQARYPKWTNHFNPHAVLFSPHHYRQVLVADLGVFLWLAAMAVSVHVWGWAPFLRAYGVPYLCVNHWVILITFLQHTDPLLPHYRAPQHTFTRGALATVDRKLMGDWGRVMAWIGSHATLSIAETHLLHHVCSVIPHYHAHEATHALRKVLAPTGLPVEGNPVSWAEMYRVYKECKFVEDEGDVVFYKNAHGVARMHHAFADAAADSDSGVDVDSESE
ncbi:Oleoyl phosphatidylcholine desaturase [Mycena indigotica]|uniref:Oleoyl phosphatidylcholine desaturase n=1 Tax=Mycena indigotica TaxID=2126181 RepID=A0A8H6SED9_9AGAR|nr:Oleoyl phosphatidylcholine desaturase [Mycena indigotica]KAF7297240.1 Oleoyl phosphatidylcholine desaturase [Mycena indigotica]